MRCSIWNDEISDLEGNHNLNRRGCALGVLFLDSASMPPFLWMWTAVLFLDNEEKPSSDMLSKEADALSSQSPQVALLGKTGRTFLLLPGLLAKNLK